MYIFWPTVYLFWLIVFWPRVYIYRPTVYMFWPILRILKSMYGVHVWPNVVRYQMLSDTKCCYRRRMKKRTYAGDG